MVYAGGRDEVEKEPASEYCSIGKATEKILEKHQPGDPGEPEAEFKEWLIPHNIVLQFSSYKSVLNWNRFLADLNRGSSSLNSASLPNRVRYVYNNQGFRSTFIASTCKYMINNECIKGEEDE